jgi:hypothetical protein
VKRPCNSQPATATVPESVLSTQQTIYEAAKSCLGTHLTLDPSMPSEVGCAEAVSALLRKARISVPAGGIAGTASLYAWLPKNGFTRASKPDPGDVIISPTDLGNGAVRGRTDIVGKSGILANDSQTGLFLELWSLDTWREWCGVKGGLPVDFFRWK